ncbi:4'-phosphopantetheinyl transferase family protein [Chitinophaga rhizophila]|uniref:4'-phosphopantetheinyl transferase superfamily protein n=1 Tax=Chitinophaga rhizophila TaxID=2866212 RepID=A0ABS7GB49_9BACT|nr:4'-phosphopantetheinyl transferase superfamily protein [Chitinophaga rhizophila]MBW8684897.1 4'-phosphopantetheinyl transferase superfamily protein [Chitinophaga rhizophila]
MPLIRTVQINPACRLGVWKIAEDEAFFKEKVNISSAIHHPHKRLQHLAGRYLLQELFPGFPLSSIQIMQSRKPYLECNSLHFSISHCGDHIAAIVSSQGAVGIDIEEVKPKIEAVSHKFLSPDEQAFIDPVNSLPHKTVCWSAKEAVYKWYGLGSVDFRENMHLTPFIFQPRGFLICNFNKADKNARLYLQYLIEDGLCLSWTNESEDITVTTTAENAASRL